MLHLIFDIGGVLIDYSIPRLIADIAAQTGVDANRIMPTLTAEALFKVESGGMTGRAFFEGYVRTLIPRWMYFYCDCFTLPKAAVIQPGRELAGGGMPTVNSRLFVACEDRRDLAGDLPWRRRRVTQQAGKQLPHL